MLIDLSVINWAAVIASAIISMVAGFIFYAKPVFGGIWMKLINKKEKDLKMNPLLVMGGTFVGSLVTAVILGLVVHAFGAVDFIGGAVLGGLVGVVVGAGLYSANGFEGRPVMLSMINALYQVIWMGIAGGLLAVWK